MAAGAIVTGAGTWVFTNMGTRLVEARLRLVPAVASMRDCWVYLGDTITGRGVEAPTTAVIIAGEDIVREVRRVVAIRRVVRIRIRRVMGGLGVMTNFFSSVIEIPSGWIVGDDVLNDLGERTYSAENDAVTGSKESQPSYKGPSPASIARIPAELPSKTAVSAGRCTRWPTYSRTRVCADRHLSELNHHRALVLRSYHHEITFHV
jgi:hypothetical protein